MSENQSLFKNLLLKWLPSRDLALIESNLQRVPMDQNTVVERAGEQVKYVYFPEQGMLSIVSKMEHGRDVEVGVIGTEGMSGSAVLLGDDISVHETNVQISGVAMKLEVSALMEASQASRTLQGSLLRYVRYLELQTASTASANGRANLDERLARWLLMTHDRVESDRINITHEFLSKMLACRRPGVTVGLHILEGNGLIRSRRGQITILDREGLEQAANGSYGTVEGIYGRLMGEDYRARRVFPQHRAHSHLSVVPQANKGVES
jgi:CRP-like cAMP-binding protein